MNRRKGDIIINPWVVKMYDGKLNPMYATIYAGNGILVDYLGGRHDFSRELRNKNPEREYKTVGHIDIDLKAMIEDVLKEVEGENE